MNQQAESLPNDSVGPKALAALTPIFAIGMLFYSLRIYTRVVPKYKLNAADWACTVAVVSETISYALFAAAVRFGFGKHSIYVSPASYRKIFQCLFGVIFTGLWSSTFSRVSIAVLLLDLAPSRAWKIALWLLIVVQFIDLLGTEFIELFQCRPIRAFWHQDSEGKCNAPEVMQILGYVYNAIGMLGDLTFAIMPIFLIWRLSRPVIERCLIYFLMTMSLFATGAGVMTNIYAYPYGRDSQDTLIAMMPLFLWCRIEGCVLIVACSAPLLKAPIGSVLAKIGFPSFRERTRDLVSLHFSELEVPQDGQKVGARDAVVEVQGEMREDIDLEKGVAGQDNSPVSSSTTVYAEGFGARSLLPGRPSSSTFGQ